MHTTQIPRSTRPRRLPHWLGLTATVMVGALASAAAVAAMAPSAGATTPPTPPAPVHLSVIGQIDGAFHFGPVDSGFYVFGKTGVGAYYLSPQPGYSTAALAGATQISVFDNPDLPAVIPPMCTIKSAAKWHTVSQIQIRCFDGLTGKATDKAAFTVNFDPAAPKGGPMYARLTTSSSTSSHTPSRQYRSDGGTKMKVKRTQRGQYVVKVAKTQFGNQGTPMVTAYSSVARQCAASPAWFDLVDTYVTVGCQDIHGKPADSRFSLAITSGAMDGTMSTAGGSAWADADGAAPGTLIPYQTFNSAGKSNTVWDLGSAPITGPYLVAFPGVRPPADTAPYAQFVNGSNIGQRCVAMLAQAFVGGTGVAVPVRCVNTATGAPISLSLVAVAMRTA